jgi:hypothetical protein
MGQHPPMRKQFFKRPIISTKFRVAIASRWEGEVTVAGAGKRNILERSFSLE